MSNDGTSLQSLNTFSIAAHAAAITYINSTAQLVETWKKAKEKNQPFLLLGEGSNVLFLEDFSGSVALNRIKGIQVTENSEEWLLHVGSGENWHELVCYALEHNIPGLENLALIPGCVGSAPIQNIGAYGIELQNVCQYVDVLNMNSGEITQLKAEECQFGYRESIFKHAYKDGYAIVAVGFRLTKHWQPKLTYGDLTRLDPHSVTPREIFDSVCAMRMSKLPDPAITGNAGSFYKNPTVDSVVAEKIQRDYPSMPSYPQANGQVKLAAGWLVEQANLKGFSIGGAAVHQNQALVLINKDHASSADVRALAKHVRDSVAAKFGIWLEPEVRFIAAGGEVNAVEALS